MSIQLNDLCPCSQIEDGDIDDCTECPYVPIYGEDEAFELKTDRISALIKSIEKTLNQLLIDIPIKDMSKIEIKEVLVKLLEEIKELDK